MKNQNYTHTKYTVFQKNVDTCMGRTFVHEKKNVHDAAYHLEKIPRNDNVVERVEILWRQNIFVNDIVLSVICFSKKVASMC